MRNFIFVWFLLSVFLLMLVSVAGIIFTGPYLAMATWTYYGSDLVHYGARNALSAYESGGLPALQNFQMQAFGDGRIRGYFFDSELTELQGRESSRRVRDFAAHLREGDQVQFEPMGRGLLAGTVLRGRSGKEYRIVSSFNSAHAFNTPMNIWGWALRIGMVFVAGALLCSWLAWRLSEPLGRLQEATRKLAAGELSVRAGAALFPKRPPEYGELARDFDEMADRIETLVNSQRRLLRDVSHELRTPLTRLGLAVNIARRAEVTSDPDLLDRIDQESGRLNALVDRIIRLSRLQTLTETPKLDAIELSDFIDSVVSDANFEAEAYQRRVIMLRCSACRFRGDRELLREALENVIRNAIRYAPEATSVSVDAYLSGQAEYIIVVRDEGPGVPAEQLETIFDPFHRSLQPASGDQGGFGLGLTIAKRAVELHHGSIKAQNCSNNGFEVHIRLPLKFAA